LGDGTRGGRGCHPSCWAKRELPLRKEKSKRDFGFEGELGPRNSLGPRKSKKSTPSLLQASVAMIYAHRFDAPTDEFASAIGGNELNAPDAWRFSIEVAKA
jgi:hypothetical protein